MLEIYTKEGWLPITNRQNYYTAYEYDGTQTLCFDISPSDEMYRYIAWIWMNGTRMSHISTRRI